MSCLGWHFILTMVKNMTAGNPSRLILGFAWPLILGSILQQGYNLIDAVIVGHYVGVNALAAVGAGSSVIFLILGFCNGCTGGFGIPIAQSFGAGDHSGLRRYVSASFRVSIAISLAVAVVTALLCADILHWMQTPDVIFHDAWLYLLITFLGIPFTMAYNLLASIIRALGDSRTPFYFLILSAVLNVALDLLFILACGWGAAGAAVATVISQGVSALLCYIYMYRHFEILRYRSADEKVNDWERQKRLLSIGLPMGLQFSITAIGSIMLQSANNALGTASVTAFTVAMRIKMFFISPCENLGVAMATYCGQNYGAGKMERIRSGLYSALGMTFLYVILGNAVMFAFADGFTRMFVDASETAIIAKSVMYLHTSSPFWVFLGTLCVLRYSIQGLGFTRLAMMSGVFEMVARIAASLWLVPALQFKGVCLGDPLAWMAACLFLIPAMTWIYRRTLHPEGLHGQRIPVGQH